MTDAVLPLAGRYRFVRALKPAGALLRWIARREDGSEVIAAVVEPQLAARLDAARDVKQLHLAAIVEVLRGVPASAVPAESNPHDEPLPEHFAIALAEYVPGESLARLLSHGPLGPPRAVAWTLRLCEAVRALHVRGAVHGAVSPAAVIANPVDRPVPPVLSQLIAPALGNYCSPERLRGASPSLADDVWALHVLLYVALTGKQPFEGTERDELLRAISTGKPPSLANAGIQEPLLHETLRRGLVVDRARRVGEVEPLIKCLDAWELKESVLPAPPSRPTGPVPSGLVSLVTGATLGGLKDVVFDPTALPDDREILHHGSRPNAALAPVAVSALPQVDIGPAAPERAPAVPQRVNASAAAQIPSANPFATKRSRWPIAIGVLVAAATAGAVLFWSQREEAPATTAVQSEQPAFPAALPSTRPAPRERKLLTHEEQLKVCVREYFPEETFDPDGSFDFICEITDLRDSAARLYEAAETRAARSEPAMASASLSASALPGVEDAAPPQVVPVDGPSQSTPVVAAEQAAELIVAERTRRPLGWYELPATAVIRRDCCPGAAPIKLPETPGWCEQLQDVLREFADDSEKVGDLAPKAKRFDKAIQCLFATGVKRPYAYKKPPDEANGTAFQRFLSHAAIVDARHRNSR